MFWTKLNNTRTDHQRVIAALQLLQRQSQQVSVSLPGVCCCWMQTSIVTSSVMDFGLQQNTALLTQVCFHERAGIKGEMLYIGSSSLVDADAA